MHRNSDKLTLKCPLLFRASEKIDVTLTMCFEPYTALL